jgi:hypothetical protein
MSKTKSDGGPSTYYDLPYQSFTTGNDQMEYLADKQWGVHSLHLKDIFKVCLRWSAKDGTDTAYDARKIIYYGARLLMWLKGGEVLRETLQSMLDHPQFGGEEDV